MKKRTINEKDGIELNGSSSQNLGGVGTNINLDDVDEHTTLMLKGKRRVMWVKKNLIDQTAVLSYSTGVSIVHLAMFISLRYVDTISMAKTEGLSSVCITEASSWDYLIKFMNINHLILFVANLYREIYSAQTSMLGQFMRLAEITCIPLYLYQLLMSVELLSLAMIRQETTNPTNPYVANKCSLTDFNLFIGTTVEWLIIEVLVFGFFVFTMFLTMIKSRFISVGMDNSDQFDDAYMQILANQIIKNVSLDMPNVEAYYINKERLV